MWLLGTQTLVSAFTSSFPWVALWATHNPQRPFVFCRALLSLCLCVVRLFVILLLFLLVLCMCVFLVKGEEEALITIFSDKIRRGSCVNLIVINLQGEFLR